ncbi:MAG: alpha-amylase family glycosyl hydrolase [Prolixibacteraceae bacterium]|nr:alpha-amylase family glycosyl hydrolase [Prolixibacteraceae bacterium]
MTKLDKVSYLLSKIAPVIFALLFFACTEEIPEVPDGEKEEEIEEEFLLVPFDKVPDLNNMVMYEVNFMAFGPNSDLASVKNKLPYIKNLGVNVIWLMPINPEGIEKGVDSPYCVQDYFDVNPDLGSVDELMGFVAEAHKMEMAVIIDWVANHTSWDNPWIDNDDWYVTNDNGVIIIPPGTNWQDVAELNFDNQEMRLEMIKAMKFWVETCNVDGFRCDAVDFVPYNFWKQAIDSLTAMEDRNLILLAESGQTNSLKAGFQMLYAWDYQSKLKSIFSSQGKASSIFTTNTSEKANVGEGKARLRYITNHDICGWEESPVKSFLSAQGSLAAFVATLMMGEVPLIYTGQEIGYPNTISFFNPNPITWDINPEIYQAYQQSIQIKLLNTQLVQAPTVMLQNDDVIAFTKKVGNEKLLVLVNTRSTKVNFLLPDDLAQSSWENLLENKTITLNSSIELDAFNYFILKQ